MIRKKKWFTMEIACINWPRQSSFILIYFDLRTLCYKRENGKQCNDISKANECEKPMGQTFYSIYLFNGWIRWWAATVEYRSCFGITWLIEFGDQIRRFISEGCWDVGMFWWWCQNKQLHSICAGWPLVIDEKEP